MTPDICTMQALTRAVAGFCSPVGTSSGRLLSVSRRQSPSVAVSLAVRLTETEVCATAWVTFERVNDLRYVDFNDLPSHHRVADFEVRPGRSMRLA